MKKNGVLSAGLASFRLKHGNMAKQRETEMAIGKDNSGGAGCRVQDIDLEESSLMSPASFVVLTVVFGRTDTKPYSEKISRCVESQICPVPHELQ